MDLNEKALLYRAHAGDRRAAGTLYERYYRDIYSYIFYRVNDPETAEDLSAEVFVHMIRHLPGYPEQGKPFISWLYGLSRKIIQDYKMTSKMSVINQPAGGNGSSGKVERDQEALGCFQRALQCLPDIQKEIIIHRFVEGRSVEDIADLTQKSAKAVQTQQFKALKSLEDALVKENCL